MKKYLLLLFIPFIFAASIQDMHKLVVGRKNVAAGGACGYSYSDAEFACSWETGSGVTNSSPSNGDEDTFSASLGGAVSSAQAFIGSNSFEYTPAASSGEYVREDVPSHSTVYQKLAFYWSAESIVDTGYTNFIELANSGVVVVMTAELYDDSGTIKVRARVMESAAWVTIGTPQTVLQNTWYEVELKYIASGTSGWRLFKDGSQVYPGSGFQDSGGTTDADTISHIFNGCQWTDYAVTMYLDEDIRDTTAIGSTYGCSW
jgi:hypothetical protein